MDLVVRVGEQYFLQMLLHSALLALVFQALLGIWQVAEPEARSQFRIVSLLVLLAGWPLYQALWPSRGSPEFRESMALFDSLRWLPVELGGAPIWGWLVALTAAATVLIVSRALIPSIHQPLRAPSPGAALSPALARRLDGSLKASGWRPADAVAVVDDPRPTAHVVGVLRSTLVLSTGLLELLDQEELDAVLAHELSHRDRRDNLKGCLLLAAGVATFYSPVALAMLQRITFDVEMASDDAAVARTRRPLALASALVKTSRLVVPGWSEAPASVPAAWLSRAGARVHRRLVVRRARRLTNYVPPRPVPLKPLKLALAALGSAALLFFVV